MATSTIRFVIIVALVVAGVVVIGQAFPDGQAALPDGGGATGDGPATPTTTPTTPPARQSPTPDLEGLEAAVYNGTSVSGLAADTAVELREQFGLDIPDDEEHLTDAPQPVAETTLYFRNAQGRVDAQELIDVFFDEFGVGRVTKLPDDLDIARSIAVAIYLGNDYATARD